MKTIYIVPLIFSVLLSGCASTNVVTNLSSGKTPGELGNFKVAVVSSLKTPESLAFSDMLSIELLRLNFRVIERNRIEAALEEQKLSLSGVLEKSNYDALGEIANLDGIFMFLAKYDGKRIDSCILKLIDVETGEVLLGTNYKASQGSDMANVVSSIARSIDTQLQKERANLTSNALEKKDTTN